MRILPRVLVVFSSIVAIFAMGCSPRTQLVRPSQNTVLNASQEDASVSTLVSQLSSPTLRVRSITRLQTLLRERLGRANSELGAQSVRELVEQVLPRLLNSLTDSMSTEFNEQGYLFLASTEDTRALGTLARCVGDQTSVNATAMACLEALQHMIARETLTEAQRREVEQNASRVLLAESSELVERQRIVVEILSQIQSPGRVELFNAYLLRPVNQLRSSVTVLILDKLKELRDPSSASALVYACFLVFEDDRQGPYMHAQSALMRLPHQAAISALLTAFRGQQTELQQLVGSYADTDLPPPHIIQLRTLELLLRFVPEQLIGELLPMLRDPRTDEMLLGEICTVLAEEATVWPQRRSEIIQALESFAQQNNPSLAISGRSWNGSFVFDSLTKIPDSSIGPFLVQLYNHPDLVRDYRLAMIRLQMLRSYSMYVNHREFRSFQQLEASFRAQLHQAVARGPRDQREAIRESTSEALESLAPFTALAATASRCNDGDVQCYLRQEHATEQTQEKIAFLIARTVPVAQQHASLVQLVEQPDNFPQHLIRLVHLLAADGCGECTTRLREILDRRSHERLATEAVAFSIDWLQSRTANTH